MRVPTGLLLVALASTAPSADSKPKTAEQRRKDLEAARKAGEEGGRQLVGDGGRPAIMGGGGLHSDLTDLPVCKCDAPVDIDKRIADAEAFSQASFASALAKRKLVMDKLPAIELTAADRVDKFDDGKTVTITRDGRKQRVRLGRRFFAEPEVVRDARGTLHPLQRAPIAKIERYDRCDRAVSDDDVPLVSGGRVGFIVDKLGGPIKLSYATHAVIANACKLPP